MKNKKQGLVYLGKGLESDDLKNILSSTYEHNNKNIGDFKVDDHLSGNRAKV